MTHSKNGKPNGKPPTTLTRHPAMRSDELTASEIAGIVGAARQTALKRQERHPERMNGRLLPPHPKLSGGAHGIWAFPRESAETWKAERAAAKAKRRRIRELRAQGFRVSGRR